MRRLSRAARLYCSPNCWLAFAVCLHLPYLSFATRCRLNAYLACAPASHFSPEGPHCHASTRGTGRGFHKTPLCLRIQGRVAYASCLLRGIGCCAPASLPSFPLDGIGGLGGFTLRLPSGARAELLVRTALYLTTCPTCLRFACTLLRARALPADFISSAAHYYVYALCAVTRLPPRHRYLFLSEWPAAFFACLPCTLYTTLTFTAACYYLPALPTVLPCSRDCCSSLHAKTCLCLLPAALSLNTPQPPFLPHCKEERRSIVA